MDLYSNKKMGNFRPLLLMLVQVIFSLASFIILLMNITGKDIFVFYSLLILVLFNLLTTLRFGATLLIFMKRQIPTEELFSVIFAFGLYYLGFFFIAFHIGKPNIILFIVGTFVFLTGSLFNFISELQRNKWKNNQNNTGKIYKNGLFAISRHPNYFGDFLWVLGYAIVSGSLWSFLIPVLLAVFFQFYNIPMQEKHMIKKYNDQFKNYKEEVKGFFPFLF